MVSRLSMNDCKAPQVSRALLSILADLNNAVVWMVSTRPVISNSSSPITNPLGIFPRAPTTNGITVTYVFHSCFSPLARPRYLSLFSFSFIYTLWYTGTAKSTIRQVLYFCWLSQRLVVWPRLGDPFVSQNLFFFFFFFFFLLLLLLLFTSLEFFTSVLADGF